MADEQNPPVPAQPNPGEAPAAPATPAPAEAPKPAETPSGEALKAGEQPKPVVPEKYELKVPDGSLLEASHVEKIASYAKERGFSNEQAQELLDRENSAVSGFAERQQNQVKEITSGWAEQAKTDKEIGGDAFAQNAELAKRVVDRFGTDELKSALNDEKVPFGNHPELIRIFTRIGKAMSEDQLVLPGAQTSTKKSMEDVFYGDSNKPKEE